MTTKYLNSCVLYTKAYCLSSGFTVETVSILTCVCLCFGVVLKLINCTTNAVDWVLLVLKQEYFFKWKLIILNHVLVCLSLKSAWNKLFSSLLWHISERAKQLFEQEKKCRVKNVLGIDWMWLCFAIGGSHVSDRLSRPHASHQRRDVAARGSYFNLIIWGLMNFKKWYAWINHFWKKNRPILQFSIKKIRIVNFDFMVTLSVYECCWRVCRRLQVC